MSLGPYTRASAYDAATPDPLAEYVDQVEFSSGFRPAALLGGETDELEELPPVAPPQPAPSAWSPWPALAVVAALAAIAFFADGDGDGDEWEIE